MIIGWLLLAGVFSFFAVSAVYWWALRAHVLDIPNERSSHSAPTPVAGGLAIAGITLVGLINYWMFENAPLTSEILAYCGGALLISTISLLDDIYSLSRLIRLAIHALVAFWVLHFIGTIDSIALPWGGSIFTGYLALPLSIAWVIGVTNAYNFMDGIDGLAGSQAVVAGLAWAVTCWLIGLPGLAFAALIVTCASLGFLMHNWPPARIFMGDVGSVFLGYTFAVMAVLTAQVDDRLLVAGAAFLAPFLFDVCLTLIRRFLQRQNLLQPHRMHLYQKLVTAGHSHRFVTTIYGTASMITSTGAILWLLEIKGGEKFLAVILALTCAGLWGLAIWAERHPLFIEGVIPGATEDSSEAPYSLSSLVARACERLGVVFLSLVSALIIRFLWMTSVEGVVAPGTYWRYVGSSIEAFKGSVIPVAALGLLVFGASELLSRARTGALNRFVSGALPYTILFSLILLYRFSPVGGSHFPRLTWVVAWAISVLIVTTGLLIGELQAQGRKEENYSFASEIIIDGGLIALALVSAYVVRFEALPLPSPFQQQLFLLLPYVVLSAVASNYFWGVYTRLWRFTGLRESLMMAQSVAFVALLFFLLRIVLFQNYELLRVPFGVMVAFPVFMYASLMGARWVRCLQYGRGKRGKHADIRNPGAVRLKDLLGRTIE